MSLGSELASWVKDAIRWALDGVHTSFVGRVERVSRDDVGWAVDVRPMYRRAVPVRGGGEKFEDLPIVPDVPVLSLYSGGWGLSVPPAVGDSALVICAEHSTGEWRTTGELRDPTIRRRHGLFGCFAILGPGHATRRFADALSGTASNALVLGLDGGIQIRIDADGIYLGRNAASFAARADAVLERLEALHTWALAHTHPSPSGPTSPPSPTVPALPPTPASVAATKTRVE